MVAGDVIGCNMPGANSLTSSMIAAFWPGMGSSLASIDGTKNVSVVQYFVLHSIDLFKENNNSETERLQHLFCYIRWKKRHANTDWFGSSAIVCEDTFEPPDACCFMPIQRVVNKCAYSVMDITFDTYEDKVLVVSFIPLKY